MKNNNSLPLVIIAIVIFNMLSYVNSSQTSCRHNFNIDHTTVELEDVPCSRFSTTLESLFPLIDTEYWIKARREPSFQDNISLSMYRYYMVQHLYARLVQIRAAKGLASTDEQKFANHVQSIAPSMPYGAFTYLNAIGDIPVMDTMDNETRLRHFFEYSFIVWPNKDGHFGPVDWDSHWMYMTFPAPKIVAAAIQADLYVDGHKSLWKLNSEHIPGYPNSTHPTPNLLGWKPATAVTIAQRQKLHLCGINEERYDVINSQFQFNPKLMTIIHEYFKACHQATINIRSWYKKKKHNIGTMEQLAWLEREVDVNPSPTRTFAFVEKDVLAMLHPFQTGTEYLSKLSLIMGFRVKKYADPDDWSIFTWKGNETIPSSWIQTRNIVFEFGDIGEISGRTIPFAYERDGIRTEFLERCYEGQPLYQ